MNSSQQQILDDILKLFENFKDSISSIAEDEAMTRIQLSTLYTIYTNGGLAMNKIADIQHCDPSNITGIVDRLVKQGYIARFENPADRRTKTLRLTPVGSEVMRRLHTAMPELLGCQKLNDKELQQLHQLLQKMAA